MWALGDEGGMAKLQNTVAQGFSRGQRSATGAPPPNSPHCSWMNTLGGIALCALRAGKGLFFFFFFFF